LFYISQYQFHVFRMSFMLLVQIDRNDPSPVFRQICDRIGEMVEAGSLKPGDRLPATRVFADRLGVHRTTVVRAFDELRALGYIEGRVGSYTTVRERPRWPRCRAPETPDQEGDSFDWTSRWNPGTVALNGHPAMELVLPPTLPNQIDFEHLSADPVLAPDGVFKRCLKHVLVHARGSALDYTEAAGWYPLRETIAARMGHHGIAVSPDETIITAGAQQALDLLLRLLVNAGDTIVVEAPTYGMAHALFRLHGVRPLEIPMLKDGLDLDRLERKMAREQPRFVFTMPNFQNPTGITTAQAHRERLLSVCEQHSVPIVEDGFEEEMKYFGQAVLPVKSMDANGIVLYVGTFSKVVFPGLRLGWIAAPRRVIEPLTDLHHAACLAGNTLAQAAVARFCSGGEYELHLRRVHRVYRRRMQTMLRGLELHMPERCSWTKPEGGYTIWLTLPPTEVSEAELVKRCAHAGVQVSAGHRYFLRPTKTAHLRLSISKVDQAEIEEGCRRLGRVLAEGLAA
jgi:DNA-binding transcriptional MocR family regulator